MQAVVAGCQVYEITRDPLSLGLTEANPSIIILFLSGHITDTNERKKILSFCTMLLLFIASGSMDLTDSNKVCGICEVIFLSGTGRGFSAP